MPSPTGGRWREAPDEGKVYVACREKAVFVRLALISPLRRTVSPEGEAKGLFYREKVYKKEVHP